MSAAVIDFAPAFDRRATHRIVSDPSVMDLANDVDADLQDAIGNAHNLHWRLLGIGNAHNLHWRLLGIGDEECIRLIRAIGSKVVHARRGVHQGLDLYQQSVAVDPYVALSIVPDDAA